MIVAKLYQYPDVASEVAPLPTTRSRRFQDQLSEPGAASFVMQMDDPDLASMQLDGTDVVTFSVDGTDVFSMLVESFRAVLVGPGERADKAIEWTGRGLLAALEEGLVFPGLGVDHHPVEEDRYFNWISPDYDDSGWDPAYSGVTVGDAKAGGATEWPIPWAEDFPDDSADIISSSDTDVGATWSVAYNNAPDQTHYSRQPFTMPSGGTFVVHFAVDNIGELYIDGVLIATSNDWQRAPYQLVDLDAGPHIAAVVWSNFPQVAPNPNGYSWSIFNLNIFALTLQAHSNASDAVVQEYQTEPPGMTPGQVMRLALEDCQAYGLLLDITLGFDDTLDSNGNPWPTVADIATKVGTDLLTFFREISGTYIDMWMPPGSLELRAVNYGTRGTASGAALHEPTDPADPTTGNLTNLVYDGDLRRVNKLLVRWASGWALESTGDGDRAALLGLGAAASRAEVTRVGQSQLAIFADPRAGATIGWIPMGAGDLPYVDVNIGDTVTIPGFPTGSSEERLLALTVTEDDANGRVIYTPQFRDVILGDQEAFAQAIKKMTNGTLRGQSKVAQPVVPTYVPRGIIMQQPLGPMPVFEFVDSGTQAGSGAQSLGSYTIGDVEDGQTFFILTIVQARSSNMTSTSITSVAHAGATCVVKYRNPASTGFAAYLHSYLIDPNGTPATEGFVVTPGNAGSHDYAWMLVKVTAATKPNHTARAVPSSVELTTYRGIATNPCTSIPFATGEGPGTFDTHTNVAGSPHAEFPMTVANSGVSPPDDPNYPVGIATFHLVWRSPISNPLAASMVWTEDLAANGIPGLTLPNFDLYLDGSFYPSAGEAAPSHRPVFASADVTTDFAASVFGCTWRVRGL